MQDDFSVFMTPGGVGFAIKGTPNPTMVYTYTVQSHGWGYASVDFKSAVPFDGMDASKTTLAIMLKTQASNYKILDTQEEYVLVSPNNSITNYD
jgi:hypothetical protein